MPLAGPTTGKLREASAEIVCANRFHGHGEAGVELWSAEDRPSLSLSAFHLTPSRHFGIVRAYLFAPPPHTP